MSFLASLSYDDLRRLRQIVWNVHFSKLPGVPFNIVEADGLIEALGPEVMETMLKRAIDAREIT